MTPTNTEALAQYEAALLFAYPEGARGAVFDCWNAARQALAAHDAEQALPLKDRPDFIAGYYAGLKDGRACERRDAAEQAAQAVPAGLYVGLIERLMRLSTRLGIADGDSVEHFAASLEDRLYAICRSAESLLDSLAPAAPAPEAQDSARTSPAHQPVHGWTDADADAARLALELECILLDPDTPMPLASRWWGSAHEALALHRQRLASEQSHGNGPTTGEQR